MKQLILSTLLLFFFSNLPAQNKLSIELKDGTTIKGFGRIKLDERILFKKTKSSEKEIYNYKTVKKLIIHSDESDESDEVYIYKIIDGSGGVRSVRLLELVKVGKLNLYQHFSSGMLYTPNMSGVGGGMGGFSHYSRRTYYIGKNGSDTVTNLKNGNTYSKRFKKIAKKFFSDCPDLLDKINTKYFEKYGAKAIVNYYNLDCK